MSDESEQARIDRDWAEHVAREIEAATGGYCPCRFITHEYCGEELVIPPNKMHEPVVSAQTGLPEPGIIGHPYRFVCRHCRAIYCVETLGERIERSKGPS